MWEIPQPFGGRRRHTHTYIRCPSWNTVKWATIEEVLLVPRRILVLTPALSSSGPLCPFVGCLSSSLHTAHTLTQREEATQLGYIVQLWNGSKCQEKGTVGWSIFFSCQPFFPHSGRKAHHGWLGQRKDLHEVVLQQCHWNSVGHLARTSYYL